MTHDTSPTIEFRFSFFPTAWEPGVARHVLNAVVGDTKLMPATRWGNEGKLDLPTDHAAIIDLLTERYEAASTSNRITLFSDQPAQQSSFELLRSEWDDDAKLGQLLFWAKQLTIRSPIATARTETNLTAVVGVAAATGAPLVEIDFRSDITAEPITIASRRELKRLVRGTVHAKAAAGPFRGLHRIPWRLVLGVDIVRTIGPDVLSRLAPEHAIDHGNGLWTLQTTTDPGDSITDVGRANEQMIIEALGRDYFCDTSQNRLAPVPPDFPASVMPHDHLLIERYGERLEPL